SWDLVFQTLEVDDSEAASLLKSCAFFAPDDVPLDVLRNGFNELPAELRNAMNDELSVDRMIMSLRRYSLIERQGDSLRVHRLVQRMVRESLVLDEQRTRLAAAVGVLRGALPSDPQFCPDQWPMCARLLAHVETVDDV